MQLQRERRDSMARDGLYGSGPFNDFGPCEFFAGAPSAKLAQIAATTSRQLRGHVCLHVANKPGVYGMIDAAGELIYVGKALRLRTRLLSYFRPRSRGRKAGRIVRDARALVWEVWGHEFAAILRETELIRRWRPRWNVQGQPLRRRLAFLCLGREPAAYAFLSRKPPRDAVARFGPMPAGPRAQEAARRLNDVFGLRDCPQPQEMIFPEQGELFPILRAPGCLRHEIGACLGPCTGSCPRPEYSKQVKAARAFLEGRAPRVLDDLEARMQTAAAAQQYELAGSLRDRWQALNWLAGHLGRLREAQQTLSFVYPLTGWDQRTLWFLIHGARVVAAVPAPVDRASARLARAAIDAVFGGRKLCGLLTPYEHLDGRWLVMSWFRKRPGELARALPPREALRRCKSAG
jgi:excinuclease ABC subunit C